MNEVQPFVPYGEATKAMQPRQGAFNDPPGAAEATAVRGTPLGELRGDPAAFEVIPMRLRVIPPVPLNQLGLAGRAPRPAAQRRNPVDQRQQLGDVVPISGRQARDERDPLRFREEVVFAARLAAIGWVRSSFFPRAARGPTNCRPPCGPGFACESGAHRHEPHQRKSRMVETS